MLRSFAGHSTDTRDDQAVTRSVSDDVIKISVTRPSPVRQIPTEGEKQTPVDDSTRDAQADATSEEPTVVGDGRVSDVTNTQQRGDDTATKNSDGVTNVKHDRADDVTTVARTSDVTTQRKGSDEVSILRQGSDDVFEASGAAALLLGTAAGGKMDAIAKSVHFLQHQSPIDSRWLDADGLEQRLKQDKLEASHAADDVTAPVHEPPDVAAHTTANNPLAVVSAPIALAALRSASVTSNCPAAAVGGAAALDLRRAHSSASFEKHRTEVEQLRPGARRSHSGGRATPSRSRHQSGKSGGPMTPLSSVFDVSSRGSVGEEGWHHFITLKS